MSRTVAFALAVAGLCLCESARADDAEDKAAALVEKLGGTVVRDDKRPDKPVIEVRLDSREVTEETLRALAPLKHLTTLYLIGTPVTNARIKELASLKHLTTLNLENSSKFASLHDALLPGLRSIGVHVIDPVPALQKHVSSTRLMPYDAGGALFYNRNYLSRHGALALREMFSSVFRP